jgi:hypothetical protein
MPYILLLGNPLNNQPRLSVTNENYELILICSNKNMALVLPE